MKLQRRRVLTKVLTTLLNVSIAFAKHPARNSGSVYRALRDFRELQDLSDNQLKRVSKYIVGKKYITISRDSTEAVRIELTKNGKQHAQSAAIQELKPVRQGKWDGKWRIVIFDIPNYKKRSRDGFAASLKKLGFLPIQKSVFVCPYPCEDELEVIADYFGVIDNVDIIIADNMSRRDDFIKAFSLGRT